MTLYIILSEPFLTFNTLNLEKSILHCYT